MARKIFKHTSVPTLRILDPFLACPGLIVVDFLVRPSEDASAEMLAISSSNMLDIIAILLSNTQDSKD